MTVNYTKHVANCGRIGCFLRILLRWRGSIYKLIWANLLIFLGLHYAVSFVYHVLLDQQMKRIFEILAAYVNNSLSTIPLSFVLGFYIFMIMMRWWQQYMSIPWPDSVAVFVSINLHGQDERGRVMRRTVMRYVCLCFTMVLILISPNVKKRFPTMSHLVDAGLLEENEKKIIEGMSFPAYSKHWMPIVWASAIIQRARKEGRIRDDFAVNTIINELNKFRGNCGVLMHFDIISMPLSYTQVVTWAVYSFFVLDLLGTQYTNGSKDRDNSNIIDLYFPIFSMLQFFFYVGWLKVGETLINPFGKDDDDFEINWMIDRNLQVSYLIVDEMHDDHPQLIRDQYWDDVCPTSLPYANKADKRDLPPEPSAGRLDFTSGSQHISSYASSGGTLGQPQRSFFWRFFIRELPKTNTNSTIASKTTSDFRIMLEADETPIYSPFSSNTDLESPLFSLSDISEKNDITSTDYETAAEFDAFEKLKAERDLQRRERQQQQLVRNINAAVQVNYIDTNVQPTASRVRTVDPAEEQQTASTTATLPVRQADSAAVDSKPSSRRVVFQNQKQKE